MNKVTALLLIFLCQQNALATELPQTPQDSTQDATQVSPAGEQEKRWDIKLRVQEKGSKKRLTDINVFLLPERAKSTTDAKGEVNFLNLRSGDYQVVINLTGYLKYEETLSLKENLNKVVYLEKDSYYGFESSTTGQLFKKDRVQKSLTQKEFLTLPGSGGDPVKAVQNLSGVNRVASGNSQIVIQGSEPEDTAYSINSHPVPIVFHFGGISSILLPEATERVDLLSAGYGPEYSRALGGIVNLETLKQLPTDRTESLVFADFFNTGGFIKGPAGDHASFLVSGRFSYISLFLKEALKDNENAAFTIAPTWSDLFLTYQTPLSDRARTSISFLFSSDELKFLMDEPLINDPSLRGEFYQRTQFYRIMPRYDLDLNNDNKWFLSASVGKNLVRFNAGETLLDFDVQSLHIRSEYEKKIRPNLKTTLGIDNEYDFLIARVNAATSQEIGGVRTPFDQTQFRKVQVTQKAPQIGLYVKNEFSLEQLEKPWILYPNLRIDHFRLTDETYLQPRLSADYKLTDNSLLSFAWGLYYQQPEPQKANATFGNPDLKAQRAEHYTVIFKRDFLDAAIPLESLEFKLFYKYLSSLVINSTAQIEKDGSLIFEKFNNKGKGRIQGAEINTQFRTVDIKHRLSYTFSQSFRKEPEKDETPSAFDQTHSLTLLSQYGAGKWNFGSRLRSVTGSPFTPIVGATFDADNDSYVPIAGEVFKKRRKAFTQIDVRVDRTLVKNESLWTWYVELQNLLNTPNEESYIYSYNYKEEQAITGLPLIPSFGIKGEF